MKKPKTALLQMKFLPALLAILLISPLLIIIWNGDFESSQATNQNLQPENVVSPSPFVLEYIVITETPIPTPTKTPTPIPTRTPTPLPYTSSDYERWFTVYSDNQSINRELLKKIAICESGLNPNAVNGIYGGLYQFSTYSWISTRRVMNLDTNPQLRFNPEEAIKTAAFKIATQGIRAWPNCVR